jgi:RHS repeat-associated protein
VTVFKQLSRATKLALCLLVGSSITPTLWAAPVVSISAPATNSQYLPPATITLTANASTTTGTITSVAFYQGTTLIGSKAVAPYTVSWASVAKGNYSITAKATDSTGLTQTSAAVLVTVDQPPAVQLTSPAVNATYVGYASIPMTATASDSDGTIAKVSFYNGTTLLGTSTTAPYSFTWNNVAPGSYSLNARATDNLNRVTTSTQIPVKVTNPISVAVTAPVANARYAPSTAIPLSTTASTTKGTLTKVEYYQGTTLIATATTAPYSASWTTATQGNYTLTARATDSQGLMATSAAVPIAITTTSSVTITAPTTNKTYAAPASVAITANPIALTGRSISKVDFYQGTTLLGTKAAAPYSLTWSNVIPGVYSLTAKATDSAAATATSSAVSITVVNNAAPAVSMTATPTTATAPGSIALHATPTDTDGTIASVAFYQGTTLLNTKTAAPWDYTWGNVVAGSYSVTAKATDNLGTTTTSTPIAVTVTGPQSKIYYIQTDQLNTPRLITDQNKAVVWQWDNREAFGNNLPNENPSSLGTFTYNPRFAGQYFDRETNLHYNYFRDNYFPDLGRYGQSDPIGLEGGPNTYLYVLGSPLRFSDPLGLNPVAGAVTGAQVGSAFGPVGTVVGGIAGASVGAWVGWNVVGPMFNEKTDDPVVYPDNPDEAEKRFRNLRGTRGQQCDDGSVWERDTSSHGGDQWKRWPDRRSWENRKPPISVWPDGRVRK